MTPHRTAGVALAALGLGTGGIILAASASPPPLPPGQPHGPATPPATPPALPPSDAWVEMHDDTELRGRKLTIRPGTDVRSLDGVPTDDGDDGFEDLAASVRWNIPVGWQLVLFEHKNFEGNRLELKGTGRTETTNHLGCFTDSASSARWEHIP